MLINIYTNYKKTSGLTLIEVMLTITIIVILAATSMAGMNKMRRPKTLVDETTKIIVNILNQAHSQSIQESTTINVCEIDRGENAVGTCSNNNTIWKNINGNKFDSRVVVSITSCGNKIQYDNGLIASTATNNVACTITITDPRTDPICSNSPTPTNTIKLWPNGVIEVEKNC